LDLALLTKWPVFLQNAFGNPAYVNQTNLKRRIKKKPGGPSKNLGGAMATVGPTYRAMGKVVACRTILISNLSL